MVYRNVFTLGCCELWSTVKSDNSILDMHLNAAFHLAYHVLQTPLLEFWNANFQFIQDDVLHDSDVTLTLEKCTVTKDVIQLLQQADCSFWPVNWPWCVKSVEFPSDFFSLPIALMKVSFITHSPWTSRKHLVHYHVLLLNKALN